MLSNQKAVQDARGATEAYRLAHAALYTEKLTPEELQKAHTELTERFIGDVKGCGFKDVDTFFAASLVADKAAGLSYEEAWK